jgi:signal transduction histidine kinase
MQKYTIITVIILCTLCNGASGINSTEPGNKDILILLAFAPNTPAYRILLDGIRQKLTDEYGDSYNLHMEYLETEKYPKGKYPEERFKVYNRKYEDVSLDLLICVGLDIVSKIKKYGDDHLKNLPAIIIDYDLSRYGMPYDVTLNIRSTVIRLKMEAGKTISEALDIFPGTSNIYFICGIGPSDSIYTKISRIESEKLDKRYKISFIYDKSMDEILKIVGNLPANSLIFLSSFNLDKDSVPYHNPESVRLIHKKANAPIFTYSDMGFGEGSFGGIIMSFRKTGILAGETAVRIINGTDPNSIKFSENYCYEYLLDWRELLKWKVTYLKNRKKGSIVMYKEETFFETYKWLLFGGILFLIFQSFLIAALTRMNRKQKQMTKHIVETDRRYRDILREDRILRTGLLSASLSHELNQPLTAILSTAQAGKRFVDSNNTTPELLTGIFDNIVEDDKRAASILKSIRGLMKQETREKEKVDLNNLISEVADLYRSKAIELNSRLNLLLPERRVFVFADAIQIQQVLLNFISNASHSIERIGNIVNIITISEIPEDGYVTVSVRDYGTGIDESVKDKLFEPFVTSTKEGTGVGLAISRYIIEDHQGKIWAENKSDGGAEFSFKLKTIYD